MTSGISTYIDFPGSGGFTFRVFLGEVYDVIGNYSRVAVTGISAMSKTFGSTWYPGGTVSLAGSVLATMDYSVPATHKFVVTSVGEEWYPVQAIQNGKDFPWESGPIPHNNDGSKTVSLTLDIQVWRSTDRKYYNITGTQNVTLTHIPRAGIVAGSEGTLGEEHTVRWTRHADTFTNTLTASCGGETITIGSGLRVDSVKWTPPIAWAANNTKGTSVQVKVVCTTYSESTVIGSTEVTIPFFIPEFVAPSVNALVNDVNGHAYKYGSYIQSKSQAEVSASGSGAYGSTIVEYSVSNGTVVKTGDLTVFDLPNVGDVKFTVIATDSRGRTASAEITISVVAYFAPTATILTAYRSDADGNQDDDGTYATVIFKANIVPLDNKNSATYTVKYRVRGRSVWTSVEVTEQAGNYAPESAVQTVPIQLDSAYELAVSAADDFTETDSLYRTVQVAFFLISVNRSKKSVGIGQKATESGLCAFGIPAKFNAGVNVGGKILTFAYNESIGGYILVETEG